MHSKYDNMNKNGIFNALIYIYNHIITRLNCMLSTSLFSKCQSTTRALGDLDSIRTPV